ncbi:MAG: DarP family protein [Desulforhopalus sp.]
MISKSARKRRFKDEENAAAELAQLSDKDLRELPAGRSVKDEIIRCRGLKAGARKRQIKYLAKVMREDSVEDILDYLAARKGSKLKENSLHREAERLRDAIINEAIDHQQQSLWEGATWEPDWPGDELEAAVARYPLDEGDLRRTVFQYVKTRQHSHYRETFRMLKAAMEKDAISRKID